MSVHARARALLDAHPGTIPPTRIPWPPGPWRHLWPGDRDRHLEELVRAHLRDRRRGPRRLDAALARLRTDMYDRIGFPDDFDDFGRRRTRTARWLLRNGTGRLAVEVGIALLAGHAETGDAEVLQALATVLPAHESSPAIDALAALPDATRHLVRVAERAPGSRREAAVRAMSAHPTPEARAWLLRHATNPRHPLPNEGARKVFTALDLPSAMHSTDPAVMRQALRLTMAAHDAPFHGHELADFTGAVAVYEAVARDHHHLGTLDDLCLLATALDQILFRFAALLPWPEGHRDEVAAHFLAAIDAGRPVIDEAGGHDDPAVRSRAGWLRQTCARARRARRAFAVEVVVPDPAAPDVIALCVLADGRPLVSDPFFAHHWTLVAGPARATLLRPDGRVLLAEAFDDEPGGELRVRISRGDGVVRWHDWERPDFIRTPPPADLSFGAAAYDAEIDRADADHSWRWPALMVADLVHRRLSPPDGPLARWGCRLHWSHSRPWERDRMSVTIKDSTVDDRPLLQREFGVPDAAEPPDVAAIAEHIVDEMTTSDPRDHMVTR